MINDTIAYCFHSVDGFSKFGSYTGNGSANGPIVETGFEPAFVMVKRTDSTGVWVMLDNKRNLTNPRNSSLYANTSAQEDTGSTSGFYPVNFYSNGFQPIQNTGDYNANNGTFIYMAFAEDPDTTAPTLADSFNVKTYTGTGVDGLAVTGIGFKPGMVWIKNRDLVRDHNLADVVQGVSKEITPNTTEAQESRSVTSFDSDGFTLDNASGNYNDSSSNYVAWAWKADDNEPTIYGGDAETIYKFEDNINDVTGRNNGGSSNVTYTTGKFNKAASFNGTTSYAYSSSTFSGINSSQFSVSCWVKFDTIGTNENIIMGRYTYTNSDQQFIIRLSSSSQWQLSKYFGNGGGEGLTTTETASTNTWYHVVSVYDNTKMSIYVDGVLLKTQVGTGVANASPTSKLHIGGYEAMPTNDPGRMDGLIDQIRIYNGVLGQAQVTELYNETASDNDDVILGGPPETIISANANSGFSIVKYTGNGVSGAKVPHGLSAKPDMVIIKDLTEAGGWNVAHVGLASNEGISLQSSAAASTSMGNNGGITYANLSATTFGFATGAVGVNSVNKDGNEYIAYCFHSVSSYSKFGSYSGTGSSGNSITTGFQPDFVMIKRTDSAGLWCLLDSVRGTTQFLSAEQASAEQTISSAITFTSTGFTLTDTSANRNASGGTYMYMAFKIN